MAGSNDFTGQNIQDTYQRVLQLSSSNQIADGTGSALPIKIEGDNVRVTGDIIAQQYVVSSSVTNITTQQLSGSTSFGDSEDDTHQLVGSVSASSIRIKKQNAEAKLELLASSQAYQSSIDFSQGGIGNLWRVGVTNSSLFKPNFVITSGSASTLGLNNDQSFIIKGDEFKVGVGYPISAGQPTSPDLLAKFNVAGDILTSGENGHITASGNISASGDIIADEITAKSTLRYRGSLIGEAEDGTTHAIIAQMNQLSIGGYTGPNPSSAITIASTNLKLIGPVTASGEISASAGLYGEDLTLKGQAVLNFNVGQDRIVVGNKPTLIQGNLTASNNISASGEIYAKGFHAPIGVNDGVFIGEGKPVLSIQSGGPIRLGANHATYQGAGVNIYATGSSSTKGLFINKQGQITASGDISASGAIHANGINNDGRIYTNFPLSENHFLRSTSATNPIIQAYGGLNIFNGAVTASSETGEFGASISASGNIIAGRFSLPSDGFISFDHEDFSSIYGQPKHKMSGNGSTLTIEANNSLAIFADEEVRITGTTGTDNPHIDGSPRVFIGPFGGSPRDEDGALTISGSVATVGINGHITASGDISCSTAGSQVIATTGSFNHIITDGDTIEFRSKTTKAKLGSMKFDPSDGLKVLDDTGGSGLFEAKEIKAANVLESNGTLTVTLGSTFNGLTVFKGTSNTFSTPITSLAAITGSSDISASGVLKMGNPAAPKGSQLHQFYGKVQVLGSDVTIGDGHITASGNISASGNVNAGNAGTGSFDHIITTDNTIEFRDAGTKAPVGFLKMTATGIEELDNNRSALNRIADQVKIQSASSNGGVQYPVMVNSINATPTAEQLKTPTFIQINNTKRAFIVQGKIAALGSSLTIESGSISASGNFFTAGAVTASGDISSSGNVSAGNQGTGSFDHIITTNNTIEFRNSEDREQVLGFAKFDAEEGLTVHSASYADTNNRRGAPADFEPMPKVSNLLRHTNKSNATIGGVPFANSLDNLTINLPGVNRPGNQNTTGTAASASFVTGSGVAGNIAGNAATATSASYAATGSVLSTARKIGGVSFDGSANIIPRSFNGSITERFVTPTEFHLSGSSFNNGTALVQYDSATRGLKAGSADRDYKVAAQVCLPVGSSLTGAYYLCTSAKATMSVTLVETLRGRQIPIQFQSGLNTVTEIPAHVMSGALPTIHLTRSALNHKGMPLQLMVTIPRGQTFQGVVLRFTV